ncbi:MAG: glycosyltransferase family 39 protein, partial [Bryobacteraceae bacterium]
MKRDFWTRLAPIIAVAFLLRLMFLFEYQQGKPHQALGAIPFLFEPGNIAYSIAQGHGFSSPFRVETGPTAWMTPVYPLILAAIFRLFGTYTYQAFLAAALLNIFFSISTCIPIYFIARRFGVALLATWLWAVFPNAILLPVESLWDASLTALLAASIIWMTLFIADKPSRRGVMLYGLLWGFTLMVSATMLAVLPFLLVWLFFKMPDTSRRIADVAIIAGLIVLSIVPWTIRNYVVFHAFVPLRSALGLQLWVGNNEHAEDRSPGQLHPIDNPDERARYI